MSVSASPARAASDDDGTQPGPDSPFAVDQVEPAEPPAPPARGPVVTRSRVVSALAGLVLLVTLVFPNELGDLTPGAFVRLPLEGLLGVLLVLLLPARAGRVVAALAGVGLAVATILSVADMGFYASLDRPFDPVFDAVLLRDGVEFLHSSLGRTGAIGAVAGLIVLSAGLLVATTAAALRARRLIAEHDARASVAVAGLAVVWVTSYSLGVQLESGVPFASKSEAALTAGRVAQARADLRDRGEFARLAAVDRFRDTPGDQLLTGLRGKDVLLTFVESYGRSAIEDPALAPRVNAVLDAGTARLAAAGYGARSGYLVSPTAGGGSWLAHSTLLSGLWIKSQQRYRSMIASDRFTLNQAFRRAGWETVGFMPGVIRAWPEGSFYGYDRLYDSGDLGYRGPNFSWATMPDQYTLAALQRLELGRRGRAPVMVELPLLSGHAPWAPVPSMIGWDAVGDGSVYHAMAEDTVQLQDVWRDVWPDPDRVREAYAQAMGYSLTSLIEYVERYGDENLVLVFLGDHQPAPMVVGQHASRDVPVTIVAKDPAVLAQVTSWGWSPGLRPAPDAPVWPMWAFRDRFLGAFGSTPAP